MQNTENTTDNRLAEINKEFSQGFKFLEDYPKSVTFFGAHQTKPNDAIYEDAYTLAKRISKELDYTVITGGSSGIMEAANKGAYEAGGESLGLHIDLPTEQTTNKYITADINFRYFFVRKVGLAFAGEAYIFYPGGYGTLDEFFEIMTLVQTNKIAKAPIICVGSEYWNKLKIFIETEILSTGKIEARDMDIFKITDDHDEILEIIKNAPVRTSVPFKV